jgi:tetratricopeptide repeat protein 21B
MLMKSEVEMRGKAWEEAKQTLEHTMKLPIVQDPSSINDSQKAQLNKFSLPFGQEERARIFLNLVSVNCELQLFDQAKRILTRAVSEFAGTPEEVRVMLA